VSAIVSVATGLDRLHDDRDDEARWVRGRSVGLLAHPASVTRELVHAKDVLVRAGARVRALFGPEHGYGGEAQDMVGVDGSRDPETGAPVYSLYGATFESLTPRREWLEGLDVLVIDLQDVGSRYYTFVWTAVLVARACSAAGVEVLVLDRPNPLGGLSIEGAPQRDELCSFVGLRPTPIRHGLTLAELVADAARDEQLQGVRILAMRGWRRSMLFEDTGLPWILPSPNMPTVDTARVYPGGCLLEGTNLSEGRGLTRPFEVFGATWIDAAALATQLERSAGHGVRARPLTFRPTFHKYAGQVCGGVQMHVTDRAGFTPYRAYLAVLAAARKQQGFAWRTEAYEFVDTHPAIDLLTGDGDVRKGIDAGASVDDLLAVGSGRSKAWGDGRERWLYDSGR